MTHHELAVHTPGAITGVGSALLSAFDQGGALPSDMLAALARLDEIASTAASPIDPR